MENNIRDIFDIIEDDSCGLYPAGITSQEFRHYLIKYLMPEGYYPIDTGNGSQADQNLLVDILLQYSPKFRKERNKRYHINEGGFVEKLINMIFGR